MNCCCAGDGGSFSPEAHSLPLIFHLVNNKNMNHALHNGRKQQCDSLQRVRLLGSGLVSWLSSFFSKIMLGDWNVALKVLSTVKCCGEAILCSCWQMFRLFLEATEVFIPKHLQLCGLPNFIYIPVFWKRCAATNRTDEIMQILFGIIVMNPAIYQWSQGSWNFFIR